ncbi:MAG: DNA repair protein RecN [Bacteroidia bacterium]
MLRHLSVKNFSLINELEINFRDGLTIITGETGAGKSILLGALGLILGQRADTQALLDRTKKCVVEGTFEISEYNLSGFFERNDLDQSAQTIIRREINTDGRSRSFINDTPVNLSVLKELGSQLVDIHSQHETLTITSRSFQLQIIDALAGNKNAVAEIRIKFSELNELRKKLDELKAAEANSKNELDFISFQFDELEKANLHSGEREKLEEELQLLNNSEEIKSALNKCAFSMNGSEQNILSALAEVKNQLSVIGKYNPDINLLYQRIESSLIELKDITSEIEGTSEKVIFDPARIEEINERLSLIYHLESKHRVNSVEELLKLKDELSDKIYNINSYSEEIEKLQKTEQEQTINLLAKAKSVSGKRNKTIPVMEKEIKKSLQELGMPGGILKIELTAEENNLSVDGIDDIKFLFSANKGINYNSIEKVASGGELSRVMLAVKSLVAKAIQFPTLIFDEIDTGISGETAFMVGKSLSGIAENHQVIAITHLPQIAGKGHSHYYVYKNVENGKTQTYIRALNNDERIVEIAKMIGGEKPSAVAMENAKELLNH